MGDEDSTIHVLGSGAVGFPLAAALAAAGRDVVAVRTSRPDIPPHTVDVTVDNGSRSFTAPVKSVSLAGLSSPTGIFVVAAKAYANGAIADALSRMGARGPVVLLQNGIGVEQAFPGSDFPSVLRGVLYVTSQESAARRFLFRPVTASPIGRITGPEAEVDRCIALLHTEEFPFRAERDIRREIWRKAILNAVFNSICPLLDADNGIFLRDETASGIAREVIRECVALTGRMGVDLTEDGLLDGMHRISSTSDGQLISTLQDLRNGRPTEIDFLNLAIARTAESLDPPMQLPRVALLGKLIAAKAAGSHGSSPPPAPDIPPTPGERSAGGTETTQTGC